MKYSLIFCIIIILSSLAASAQQKINSSVYDWEKLSVKKTQYGDIRTMLHGSTRSLKMFDVEIFTLRAGNSTLNFQVKNRTDELLIIKEGTAEIKVNNAHKTLGPGSIVVDSPGDEVTVTNTGNSGLIYYRIGFEPYPPKDIAVSDTVISPVLIDWNSLVFKPTANGGGRKVMQQKTAGLRELEIHVTTLKEGLPSHAPHSHPDEEIILVRHGTVEETINGKPFRLGPGSLIFLTNDDMHGIGNAGKGECEYYAIRWLVNNPGQTK